MFNIVRHVLSRFSPTPRRPTLRGLRLAKRPLKTHTCVAKVPVCRRSSVPRSQVSLASAADSAAEAQESTSDPAPLVEFERDTGAVTAESAGDLVPSVEDEGNEPVVTKR